jgi:Bacterial Ig-like domain (group 3)
VATSPPPVTLTATVAPTAAGTVQFTDGATNVGAPVTVSGGTAAITQVFAAGAHSFVAAFTPAAPASFAPSASTSQAFTVTAFTGVSASETVETVVAAGSLTISVADNSKVVLPPPTLNGSGTYLSTQSTNAGNRLHAVTVTDTRAGNPGWVASGQVSDFHNIAGADTTPIAGVNLGWFPGVISSSSGAVVAGPNVAAGLGLAANPATPTPLVGLQVARTLATAAPGAGTGTSLLDAGLVLNVPTTVIAGTYDATLTLTAI